IMCSVIVIIWVGFLLFILTISLFLGIYRKPFLLALPTSLVKAGEKVTLECHSEIMFETFILTSHRKKIIKTSFKLSAESHLGGSHGNFSIGPVTPDHAGTYTCYGSYNRTPYEWSKSSDPVDIKITGLYKKPSLSALIDPVVMSGENMTLSCVSDIHFDMFHLTREGVTLGQGLPAVQSHNGTFQSNFLLGLVVQGRTYRCYGSFKNSSHAWSSPSDPMCLPVTGKKFSYISQICVLLYSYFPSDNHKLLYILIRLLAFMMIVLLILVHSWCYAKRNKYQEEASEYHLRSVKN
uniref:Immunoglobulin domain-containing protein n=1 Tax=Peromyscus maniculatus bairdii TaxID=230844 RepID=A0A8C8UP33_PERMB